ncbi:MAG: hypothetical protein AVDCRST_MAG88-1989 [uncultured Thermomicrobiales bacterium]|uniref:Uncharacterized protein n=1 Tax=uncultured Thermomicrobiales bacterium TaxID=1645740 RepID=A0A6J4V1U4_9BACT|nr:MAG: hypothetical protein AVDCRST_MAG88-1989 [uncultured Thermomicrobiales bacterium]
MSAAPHPVSASPWRSLLWGMFGALILPVPASGVAGAGVPLPRPTASVPRSCGRSTSTRRGFLDARRAAVCPSGRCG